MQPTQNMAVREHEQLQVVTFLLGTEEFAFDLAQVKEIIRVGDITRVPKCPDFIVGVFNLRGNIIPIADLKKKLGRELTHRTPATRIIVGEVGDIVAGFLVDAVIGTRQIPVHTMEAPPTTVMACAEYEYIQAVAKLEDRLFSILNMDKILVKKKEMDNKEQV
jgi:purine-binding chemotaxis protein CheW